MAQWIQTGKRPLQPLRQEGFQEQKRGDEKQEEAEEPLQLPFGKPAAVPGAPADGQECHSGQDRRGRHVHRTVQMVNDRPDDTGKNDGDQTRPVRLLLPEFQQFRHQGDHDHAATHPHQSAEENRQSNRPKPRHLNPTRKHLNTPASSYLHVSLPEERRSRSLLRRA